MIIVDINVRIVGRNHMFDEAQISNWVDVINVLTTESCDFEITYDDVTYTGGISKSEDGTKLLVVFDASDVALPSGLCLIVDCADGLPVEECPNSPQTVSAETKLSVLGSDGCPIGFVTGDDLKELIIDCIKNSSITLCDILDGGIPEGSLTAQDRVVTTSGECTLKSVPQSDIKCPQQ